MKKEEIIKIENPSEIDRLYYLLSELERVGLTYSVKSEVYEEPIYENNEIIRVENRPGLLITVNGREDAFCQRLFILSGLGGTTDGEDDLTFFEIY